MIPKFLTLSQLYGAIFGAFFFASIITYAIYLAVLLTRAPPVETSLVESTGRHVYNITIQCVDLFAIARAETPDYSYDLSGSGDNSDTDYSSDYESGSDFVCKEPKTCYLPGDSQLDCGAIDDPYAECVSCGACKVVSYHIMSNQ